MGNDNKNIDNNHKRNIIILSIQRIQELWNMPVKDLCFIHDQVLGLPKNYSLANHSINKLIFDLIEYEFECSWKDIFLVKYDMVIESKYFVKDKVYQCCLRLADDNSALKSGVVEDYNLFEKACKDLFPEANFSYFLDEAE